MELAKKYSFQQNVYIKDIDFSDEFINKVKKVKLKKVSNGSEINETSFYNKTIDSSIVSESEKILLEIVKQYKEDFKFKKFNIKSLWVQKYKKNNCHGVHIHGSNEKTFSFTIGDANYLPQTDHYYEFVSDIGITWTQARTAAAARNYPRDRAGPSHRSSQGELPAAQFLGRAGFPQNSVQPKLSLVLCRSRL